MAILDLTGCFKLFPKKELTELHNKITIHRRKVNYNIFKFLFDLKKYTYLSYFGEEAESQQIKTS